MTTTTVYRLFDASGSLLYVGIASKAGRRLAEHANNKAWWSEVGSITFAQFDSRDEAANAEREAIRTESPRYNVMGVVRPIPDPSVQLPSRADLVPLDVAARRLGISRATAYRLVADDAFLVPVLKLGRSYRVSRRALDRLLAELEGSEAAS